MPKNLPLLAFVGFLTIAIPATIIVSSQNQDLRQRALTAYPSPSPWLPPPPPPPPPSLPPSPSPVAAAPQCISGQTRFLVSPCYFDKVYGYGYYDVHTIPAPITQAYVQVRDLPGSTQFGGDLVVGYRVPWGNCNPADKEASTQGPIPVSLIGINNYQYFDIGEPVRKYNNEIVSIDTQKASEFGPDTNLYVCSGLTVVSPSPYSVPTPSSSVCLPVITYARSLTTHICQTFNNSCLPDGWVADPACRPSPSPTARPIPTPTPCPLPVCAAPPPGCRIRDGNTCNPTEYCSLICATSTPTPISAITVSSQVNQSTDDAEETISSKYVNLTSSDLELGADGSALQIAGMRFRNVQIPRGKKILNAYIEFQVDETSSTTDSVVIRGWTTDNSSTFTTTSGNLSGKSKTLAAVSWINIPGWTSVGVKKQSPNIAAVVQEIVNRTGWKSANALTIFITPVTGSTGRRTAQSYNGVASAAPKLVITYQN